MLQYFQAANAGQVAGARLPARVLHRLVRLAAAAVMALTLVSAAHASTAQLLDQPAPDFVLRSFDGANLRLSEHLGEVVILNFWATWCGPCRQEMPLLDELYNKYRRAGLVLLSVNLDDTSERAMEMAQALKLSYPVLIDARKQVGRSYQIDSLPATVLIDREGVVRYVSEGYKPGYEKGYTEQLRKLLNE